MNMERIVFLNGDFVAESNAKLSIFDRVGETSVSAHVPMCPPARADARLVVTTMYRFTLRITLIPGR